MLRELCWLAFIGALICVLAAIWTDQPLKWALTGGVLVFVGSALGAAKDRRDEG